MLKHAVRTVAVTSIMIVSAAALAVTGAAGASAATLSAAHPSPVAATATAAAANAAAPDVGAVPDTSGVLCNTSDDVWPCLKIYGSGLTISSISTWGAYNPPAVLPPPAGPMHIELYVTNVDEPLPPDPPNPADIGFLWNSGDFTLQPSHNSTAFNVAVGDTFGQDLYACAAIWFDQGTRHSLDGWECGAVYR